MITTDKKLIYADLSYSIRGAVFNVYNSLGFGHKEQVYQTKQQLLHYLKSTNYQLGLLINFGASKLYIKRLVWTMDPCESAKDQCKSVINSCKSV
ncbi:MAG: GxxExxY protein [Candidatus Shapirobacteria bacterium]|jgi:hypothetical protein